MPVALGLLSVCERQAAARQLRRRSAEPHRGDRRVQPHPQGLRRRRGPKARERARVLRRRGAHGGRVPPHHEDRLGQLPRELGAGHHEAREGQGRARAGLRPKLDAPDFFGSEVTHDLDAFKSRCDIVIVNRWFGELADMEEKAHTRDLFRRG